MSVTKVSSAMQTKLADSATTTDELKALGVSE